MLLWALSDTAHPSRREIHMQHGTAPYQLPGRHRHTKSSPLYRADEAAANAQGWSEPLKSNSSVAGYESNNLVGHNLSYPTPFLSDEGYEPNNPVGHNRSSLTSDEQRCG